MTERQVLELTAMLPEVQWTHGDDLCDCTFQRIGEWTNPYLGRTMRIRLCCVWKELAQQYPQYVELDIPGYWDSNEEMFITQPMDWDSEEESMPRYLWYRQLAARTGLSLDKVRDLYRYKQPPGPVPVGYGRESRGKGEE